MSVAFELGFIIALPIVILGMAGKWLDQRNHTGYFIYLGIALAVLSTSIWMYARFAELIRKLEEAAQLKKSEQKEEDKK